MRRILIVLALAILVTRVVAGDLATDIARAQVINVWLYETVPYVGLTPMTVQTPADTLMKGGDCADLSGAMIALLNAEGIYAEMQTMYLLKEQQYHAVVMVHGYLFDPTRGEMYALVFPRPHTILRKIPKAKILADWAK